MTILLVCPYRLSDLGGVTVMVARLQEGMRARGHRALILEAGPSRGVSRSADTGRADAYRIYLRGAWHRGARARGVATFLAFLPLTLWALWRFCRRERIDVVHAHFPTPRLLYFGALRLIARWKLVATFHGSDGYSLPRRSRWYRGALRLALRGTDLVTAVSADLLAAVERGCPGLRTRRMVLRNGNPMAGRAPGTTAEEMGAPAGPYVLAVGSLIPRKAYDVLLDAMRMVRGRGCDLRLVIVGDGPEAARLAELAARSGIAGDVSFVGERTHEEVGAFYDGARFFVHAAREEGFGMVVLEAMSRRKAVVATRVGGIPEFVRDGETGILVPPDDPASLADGIMRLEKDEALRSSMGERGHELATSEYGWERMVDEYLGAFERIGGRG